MDLKLFCLILISLCYVKCDSNNEELSVTISTEIEPNKLNATEIGAREYLSPNLVALHNMAMVYLPKSLNFLNIIEAYREIVDGVRFELLVNTTNDQNEEFICRIVLKDLPWLITTLGEKQYELIYSNCTTLDNNNNNSDQEFINNKYKKNTVFNKENTELTYDLLSILESQIIEPKKPVGQRKNNDGSVGTTDNNNVVPVVDSIELSVTNSNLPETETEILKTVIKKPSLECSTSTESGVKYTLNNEDAQYLDNFFSFFNFGNDDQHTVNSQIQISNESASNIVEKKSFDGINNSDQISNDDNSRKKRSISKKKIHFDKNEYLFEKFQTKYNKIYANSLERDMRYRIFKSNMIKIKQLNQNEQGTAKYGITEFTDMTLSEYQMRTGLRIDVDENRISNPIAEIPNIKLPESFDWRKRGVISEVKNQGSCGSCWAFSVIGNIEGLNAIKTGNLQEFSEQELVDCDTIDSGCGGGFMDNAYKAIESIGGLEFETEYPYKAHKEKCNFNKSLSHIQIKGGIDLPKNETAMALWLVANGPISIGLNANAMQFYRGGVSHPWWPLCRPGSIDHGVLIVGFGKAEYPLFNKTLPYWIVKNSWGPTWGEQGYYRVYRGDNTCGINSMATSAVL